MQIDLRHGDSLLVLPTLADNSLDCCVCDPPYMLGQGTFTGRRYCLSGILLDVNFPNSDYAQAEFGSDSKFSTPCGGVPGLDSTSGAVGIDAGVSVPIGSVDFQSDVKPIKQKIKTTRKTPQVISDGELTGVNQTQSGKFFGNYIFNLRDFRDTTVCNGFCRCFTQEGPGRVSMGVIVTFLSDSSGFSVSDTPSRPACVSNNVGGSNDTLSNTDASSGIMASGGTEVCAMLTLDITKRTGELRPAIGADQRFRISQLLTAERIGTSTATGGLPSEFKAFRISLIGFTTNRTITVYLHKAIVPRLADKGNGGGFMNAKWDHKKDNVAVNVDFWREVWRVLKPGAFLLAFGGTRTSHRMVCAIEDAGFYIADAIRTPCWVQGAGFPKSHNISKSLDGVLGKQSKDFNTTGNRPSSQPQDKSFRVDYGYKYESLTDAAKQYAGFGTALKPAHETICMARKPNEKRLTIAQNVLKWGTGGLNIDACRVSSTPRTTHKEGNRQGSTAGSSGEWGLSEGHVYEGASGRWPSNVILSPFDAARIDAMSGVTKSTNHLRATGKNQEGWGLANREAQKCGVDDSGGASRFFHTADFEPGELDYLDDFVPLYYVAKASQAERHAGMGEGKNTHPTVKPLKLLQFLSRLVCPPSGIMLDPFMGSGSGGIAAIREGFQYIGIEREEEYFNISQSRIQHEIEQAQARETAKVPTLFDAE